MTKKDVLLGAVYFVILCGASAAVGFLMKLALGF